MLFEMPNDLVPVLVSISVYFTFFAIHFANVMIKQYVFHRRFHSSEKFHSINWNNKKLDGFVSSINETQRFITRTVKRKEAPEDDTDDIFSSKEKTTKKIRGGVQWETTQYSPLLKDIVSYY